MKIRGCVSLDQYDRSIHLQIQPKNAKYSHTPFKMTLKLKLSNSNLPGFFLVNVSMENKSINHVYVHTQ